MKKYSLQRNQSIKKSLSFTIAPVTTSEAPHPLQAGTPVVFKIQVQNQSNSADIIFLKCSELPTEWVTIEYLNATSHEAPGIVQLHDKLSLNPQESGEIQLTLHPPIDAPVGNYFPTLQLVTMSAPDLVILDVIYLQVLPDTHLDAILTPESRTLPNQPATFNFKVRNRGNVTRMLRLDVKDSSQFFQFQTDLENNVIKLAPRQEITIALQAIPRNPWKRPLRGHALRSQMGVTLIAIDGLADAGSRHTTLGNLIWLPHPKWVLALLMMMGTGTALFALGVLYRFNRPAIASAEIVNFNAATQDDTVQLNWKVKNPETLGKVVVSQLNEGAEIQTVRYDFSGSIPADLKLKAESQQGCRASTATKSKSSALWQLPLPKLPWFSELQQVPAPTTIDCRKIPFTSKPANNLRYRLKIFAKSDPQVPIAEFTTTAIAQTALPAESGTFQSESSPGSSPPQAARIGIALSVNGVSAQNQPSHTVAVGAGEIAEFVVSWSVSGSSEVQLLPSGAVEPNSSTTYRLRAGESRTVTLTAQNPAGERVSQSVVINAIARENRDRSPFRSSSPFQPAPRSNAQTGDPTPPEPENRSESASPNASPSAPNSDPNTTPVEPNQSVSPSSEPPTPSASPTGNP